MENIEDSGTAVEIKDPKAVLTALERAKNDAKKFREEKALLEAELAKASTEIGKYSGGLLREKVKHEINKLNISNTDRIFKYLKLEELSFDEDLNLVGLDNQIESIKQDFPELFDPKLLVGGKADSAETKSVDAKITTSQILANIALGR